MSFQTIGDCFTIGAIDIVIAAPRLDGIGAHRSHWANATAQALLRSKKKVSSIAAGYERRMRAAAGATNVLVGRSTMRTREVMKVCLVLCCTATMVLGQPYSWSGDGGDDDWCNSDNWDCLGTCFCFQGDCGYPDDYGDDAGIRSGGPTIDICDVTIDDLDISADVDFDSASGSPATITVDSLTIGGGTIVTLTADVTIEDSDS